MSLAELTAKRSKDLSTKVGAVIVTPDNGAQVLGYNGFPRGVDDNISDRHLRPMKYLWTEHAERNAIYNAARNGVRTAGCTIYVPYVPCVECARAIIQAGITRFVTKAQALDPRWAESVAIAEQMLTEAGVEICRLKEPDVRQEDAGTRSDPA